MTPLRARIAERLVQAKNQTAMLTTFNEVDMTGVIALRTKYQETFQARHNGTRLGYMSFFVRAAVEALKRFPSVNASLDGRPMPARRFDAPRKRESDLLAETIDAPGRDRIAMEVLTMAATLVSP